MLSWLVIGIGDITTKRVLPAILAEPRSRLAGIVTRHPEKAINYGVPAWTELGAALSESESDAVYVATPVFLHAPQTIAALRAGKHVLCEKPMALNYAQACEMQQVAIDTGRTLGVAYYRRTYPKVDRAKELIASGAIGRPVFAEATSHGWSDFTDGDRQWLADPTTIGRRAAVRHRLAPDRSDELPLRTAGASDRATFDAGAAAGGGGQRHRAHRVRERRTCHGGRALALSRRARRVSHPRHRWRNRVDAVERPVTDAIRRAWSS